MQFNIKTSSELVKKLTNRMQLGEENHIARISLAYSLAKGATYTSENNSTSFLPQFFSIELSGNVYFPNPRKHTNIVQCYFLIFVPENGTRKSKCFPKKTGLAVSA